ncbi:hypothetical protein LEP1GSC089_1525 [Leptospira interrogans serovar Autumnalis str. LP101]|nr:hypothetical protein LEP1GSC089_1525 [Leptospira interrogans serovar Autumnalis str. LP101]
MHNVWSAELGSSEGEDNFESLKKKLPLKTKVIVRSRSKDVYGRYVGEVLYSKKKIQHPVDIFTIGIYLNQVISCDQLSVVLNRKKLKLFAIYFA